MDLAFKNLDFRKKLIEEQIAKHPEKTDVIYDINNTEVTVQTISIPIDTLIFNPDNTRVKTDVLGHLGFKDDSKEAFDQWYENKEVQENQNLLFTWCLREAKGKKPVYNALKNQPRVTHPILISRTGVIVDGNRRYASMVDLFKIDDSKYSTFETITCNVLPDPSVSERDENRDFEATIHLSENLQLEHSYISQALTVEHYLDNLNWSKRKLAEKLGYSTTGTVNKLYFYGKAFAQYIQFRKKFDKEFNNYENIYSKIDGEGVKQDLFAVGEILKQAENNPADQASLYQRAQIIFLIIFADLRESKALEGRTYNLTSKSKRVLDAMIDIEDIEEDDIVAINKKIEKLAKSNIVKVDEFITKVKTKINKSERDDEIDKAQNLVKVLLSELLGEINSIRSKISIEHLLKDDTDSAKEVIESAQDELEKINGLIDRLY
jgi:hypothetical protein